MTATEPTTATGRPERMPDRMVVIDVECTTDDNGTGANAHEIFEWPAVLVDRERRGVVATFHEYVRPEERPTHHAMQEPDGYHAATVLWFIEDGNPYSLLLILLGAAGVY